MQVTENQGDQGRAARYLARVNSIIIKAAAERRQGYGGRAAGKRPPASLAGAKVRLVKLPDDGRAGTPPGYKTATRSLPRALASLHRDDPRLRAAIDLADTVERIGSVKGADLQGSVTKAALSDGGATTRVQHAARLSVIEALANGWPITRTGRVDRGPERLALPVTRRNGRIQQIKAFPAILAMCVDGVSADDLLRVHGWSVQTETRRRLLSGVLAALDDVADGLGFGRWDAKKA